MTKPTKRAALEAWEKLGYGMFIHFGMSTYDGEELSPGTAPPSDYNPTKLDVRQWLGIARDAGMRYAVLTAKHVSGFCLWPSEHTEYHVGNSGNTTDVVKEFVETCHQMGLMPGLYYCSWDNRHRFGSRTPSDGEGAYTTLAYQDFQMRQIRELLSRYEGLGEMWIDIPNVLPRGFREALYDTITEHQPEALVMMNHGISDATTFKVENVWPTDLVSIERTVPSGFGYKKVREIEGEEYYLPAEVCETVSREWFYKKGDEPRSDRELLGLYLLTRERGANMLLDVGPDRDGLVTDAQRDALMRLQRQF